jgi:hypothetical protein
VNTSAEFLRKGHRPATGAQRVLARAYVRARVEVRPRRAAALTLTMRGGRLLVPFDT